MTGFARRPKAIFLMGPTASGKTGLAVALAQRFPIEIISVDSALVYQGMDIGTAKPNAETRTIAPHFLVDITLPTHPYSAADFRNDALEIMRQISERGHVPLLVGGTMLYFKALTEGLSELPQANPEIRRQIEEEAEVRGWPFMHRKLSEIDPETAERLQPNDMQRIERALEVYLVTGQRLSDHFKNQQKSELPYDVIKLALMPGDRQKLHARIAERFEAMLKSGLVEEVKSLMSRFPELNAESTAMRCVGYRQVLAMLHGEISEDQLMNQGIFATRQLAKRQMTWLRNMADVMKFDCFESHVEESVFSYINQFINDRS